MSNLIGRDELGLTQLLTINDEGFLTDHGGRPIPYDDAVDFAEYLLEKYKHTSKTEMDRQDFIFIYNMPINDQGDGNVADIYRGEWWPDDDYRDRIMAMRRERAGV